MLGSPINFKTSHSKPKSSTSTTADEFSTANSSSVPEPKPPPKQLLRNTSTATANKPPIMDPRILSRILGGTDSFGRKPHSPRDTNDLIPPDAIKPQDASYHFNPIQTSTTQLPLRLPPQTPVFQELDAFYDAARHPILGPQGRRAGYDSASDESISQDALAILEKHVSDRVPYAQLASQRLNAALSIRNENPFELPIQTSRSLASALFPGRRKDSGVGMGFELARTVGLHVVDKDTGQGLREFLLQKGKEGGMSKRECKSISIHDFTPDVRTLQHTNVLLAHYDVKDPGERCDVYEVDLPTVTTDPTTGKETQTSEPWIWILISRALISINPNNTATLVTPQSQDLDTPFATSHAPHTNAYPKAPPNFPYPIPSSWIVFAAPMANTSAYPETIDSTATDSRRRTTAGRMVCKRRDFDFAHNGKPLFEFSASSTNELFASAAPSMEFLSVEEIGPWSENDGFEDMTAMEYAQASAAFDHACLVKQANAKCEKSELAELQMRCDPYESDEEGAALCNGGVGVASPMHGVWWREFYKAMYEDRRRWMDIKKAMTHGYCRVVTRWIEWDGEGQDGDVDMEALENGVGSGLGNGSMDTMRPARNEVHQQSGPASTSEQFSTFISRAPAFGESSRARAMGNAVLGGAKEMRKK